MRQQYLIKAFVSVSRPCILCFLSGYCSLGCMTHCTTKFMVDKWGYLFDHGNMWREDLVREEDQGREDDLKMEDD